MGPIGDITSTWTGATQNLASRSRALQKLSAPSDLHSGLGDQTPPRQDFHGPGDTGALACSGTDRPVPFRYASRLVSPFVAQLLGQLLPNPEIPASQARAAYGVRETRASLLLDARL
jgi:hypothetical protein